MKKFEVEVRLDGVFTFRVDAPSSADAEAQILEMIEGVANSGSEYIYIWDTKEVSD